MNKIQSFVKNTIKSSLYYGSANILVKILVPINIVLVISALTTYQYGVYKLTFSLFVVINGLLVSGLNGLVLNESSRYLGENRKNDSTRLLFEFFVFRFSLGIIAGFFFIYLLAY